MKEDWVECLYKDAVFKIATSKQKLKQKEYLQIGSIPVIDQGQSIIGGYTNDKIRILECKLPVIIFGDHTKNVKLIKFPFAPGADGTKVLEPKKYILPSYLYYITEVLVFKIKDKGYARHFQYIEKEKFPLVSIPTQKAIVKKIEELFSSLDSGIADLKKAQEQLVVYRQAVLKKAFEGELTKEWRERQTDLPSAKDLLKHIKEERQKHYEQQLEDWKEAAKVWEESKKLTKKPIKPKLPVYFEELSEEELKDFNILGGFYTKMGNLSDVVRGGSPRPAGDDRFYNGSIPFLKVADLTRKEGMFLDSFTYTIKEAGLRKTRMLDIGTLIISNSGATLGVPKITAIKATANDGIAAFLGLTKKRSVFLYHYWNSKTLALRAIDQGAGQPNLNTDLLKSFPVPVFSYQEQNEIIKEIESRLSVCDAVEQSIEESLLKATALRQSILKKAFEGKLLTKEEIAKCKAHKDYEPASALLEKIKLEKKKNKK